MLRSGASRRAWVGAVLFALTTASGIALAAETRIALANGDFEAAASRDGRPSGWSIFQHAGDKSYAFVVDPAVTHGGKQSVRIENVGPEPYGTLAQRVPAAALAGQTVRFSLWLKTRDCDGRGVSLLANSDSGSERARGEKIRGTTDWTRHSVTLPVPAGAAMLRVGVTLEGKGTVWVDDAELEVVPAR